MSRRPRQNHSPALKFCLLRSPLQYTKYPVGPTTRNNRCHSQTIMPSEQYEELLKIFRPERDLVPDDFISAENGDIEQATGHRKKDWLGQCPGNNVSRIYCIDI